MTGIHGNHGGSAEAMEYYFVRFVNYIYDSFNRREVERCKNSIDCFRVRGKYVLDNIWSSLRLRVGRVNASNSGNYALR